MNPEYKHMLLQDVRMIKPRNTVEFAYGLFGLVIDILLFDDEEDLEIVKDMFSKSTYRPLPSEIELLREMLELHKVDWSNSSYRYGKTGEVNYRFPRIYGT